MEWKNVTNCFTEEQRHYKEVYLEIDHVGDEEIEVSLFSSKNNLYEIYVSFGIMFGIVYVKAEDAYKVYYEIKDKLEEEYIKNKKPSDKFINEFGEKYGISLPNDLFFDVDKLFRMFDTKLF